MERYVVLDMEVSGLDCENDSLIGIYCVEVNEHFRPTGNIFFTRLSDCTDWNPNISEIMGYYPDDFKDAPTFDEIKDDFLKFIKNKTIVGWSLDFDLRFLEKALGYSIPNDLIDIASTFREQHAGEIIHLDRYSKYLKNNIPKEISTHYALGNCYQILKMHNDLYFK